MTTTVSEPVSWALVIFMIGSIVRYGQLIQKVSDLGDRIARLEKRFDREGD